MTTSLYIPFSNLTINNEDGHQILYENLVQSGPAYRLIVHESSEWRAIKERMPWPEMIDIIPDKKAEQYKEITNKYFSPVTEAVPYITVNDQRQPTRNLVTDLRRALSYILIAHDHRARIFEDDILTSGSHLSTLLKQHTSFFSDEAIKRVEFVENLLSGYRSTSIHTLSTNKDERIFKDLMDLLKQEEVQALSKKNFLFGVVKAKKDILEREIKEIATRIVKNKWFPYIVEGTFVTLSYYFSLGEMEKILSFLSGFGAEILGEFDFMEYAPPIQNPRLFELTDSKGVGIFSYTPFNYEVGVFVSRSRISGNATIVQKSTRNEHI